MNTTFFIEFEDDREPIQTEGFAAADVFENLMKGGYRLEVKSTWSYVEPPVLLVQFNLKGIKRCQ